MSYEHFSLSYYTTALANKIKSLISDVTDKINSVKETLDETHYRGEILVSDGTTDYMLTDTDNNDIISDAYANLKVKAHELTDTTTISSFYVDDGTDIKKAAADVVNKSVLAAAHDLDGVTSESDIVSIYVDNGTEMKRSSMGKVRSKMLQSGTFEGYYAEDTFELIYPVGSIYMSVDSTSPQTLFGFGTWAQIKDTFLLAAGDTHAGGTTGGEAEHTLTISEMPSHTHTLSRNSTTNTKYSNWPVTDHQGENRYQNGSVGSTGGGAAHNNMPPYLAVYMWKRTA